MPENEVAVRRQKIYDEFVGVFNNIRMVSLLRITNEYEKQSKALLRIELGLMGVVDACNAINNDETKFRLSILEEDGCVEYFIIVNDKVSYNDDVIKSYVLTQALAVLGAGVCDRLGLTEQNT